jgi:hypothetical protein
MTKPWKQFLVVLVVLGVCAAAHAAATNRGLSSADVVPVNKPAPPPPAPPDPNVVTQGGDTCAAATAIPSLPYSDAGTTTGYTNDYDAVCPYTGSTSPDVVYSFTPAANMSVNVTLCTATTNYDTKLYVYAGTCGSGEVACNDDACSSPLSSYVSRLDGVALTGGTTYYFVVDGYGGAAGNYTIEFTEAAPAAPTTCPTTGTLYSQLPHGPADTWSAGTSGQTTSFNYTVAENFDGTLMSIADFHWWGLALAYAEGWSACPSTAAMTFDVRFYADNAGVPGTEICAYPAVAPIPGDTYLLFSGYTLYYWELPILTPACVPTGASWVTVKSLPNADECTFLWMSGTGGNGDSLQMDASVGSWSATGYDRGMCVTGTTVPVGLQNFQVQ